MWVLLDRDVETDEQKQLLQSQTESLESKIKEYSAHLKQSYQDQLAQESCQLCQAGQYQPREGGRKCHECTPGTYQNEVRGTSCKECDYYCAEGQFHSGCGLTKAGQCSGCPTGQFKATAGTHGCTSCGLGTFADVVGHVTCKKCPKQTAGAVGKYQDQEGQDHCDDCDYTCPVGQEHAGCEAGSPGSCVVCQEGHAKESAGVHLCEECENFAAIGCPSCAALVGAAHFAPADMDTPDMCWVCHMYGVP